MDAEAIKALVEGLSGPGASFILLAVVLYFGWKLLNRFIGIFTGHLESIEGKFDKLIEVLGAKVQQVESKVDEVAGGVQELAEDVAVIRRRLKELSERKEQ